MHKVGWLDHGANAGDRPIGGDNQGNSCLGLYPIEDISLVEATTAKSFQFTAWPRPLRFPAYVRPQCACPGWNQSPAKRCQCCTARLNSRSARHFCVPGRPKFPLRQKQYLTDCDHSRKSELPNTMVQQL